MYLRRVQLRDVRSFRELTWALPADVRSPGWHVILGDNGAGKSAFLRAVTLAMIGPWEGVLLPQPWNDWVRKGADQAAIDAAFSDPGFNVSLVVDRTPDEPPDDETFGGFAPQLKAISAVRTLRNLWGPGAAGTQVTPGSWFCASYGPFRRFTGGDENLEKFYGSNPRLARHLSMFGEAVSLSVALPWLQSLKFKQLEGASDGELLTPILGFINQPGLLPHDVRIHDVSSSGVELVDGNGVHLPIDSLSDGYRSVLSMTLELVRQAAMTFPAGALFSADHAQMIGAGIVVVDEIDAHLHPSWQRTIGIALQRRFPNVQFIVSTHSALVCQAAEIGSVFRLPVPGDDADRGELLTGVARDRLIYGDVLDAYGTGAFGDGVTRSDSGKAKLERLADLNTRELSGNLSPEERREQGQLRAIMSTDASVTHSHDPAA
jgi:hypothetical protein